jgi:uncharacterized protein (DUF2252 family)
MIHSESTAAERRALGRSLREKLPRIEQCEWQLAAGRPDPVEFLAAACKGRIPELLPIRWGRMLASPFGFFRGNVPLMAWDLSHLRTTGIETQICGDAHVRNLGLFASPTGALVFDINDFDESIRGPWEWDLKRLAVSLVLAGRDAGNSRAMCKAAVLELVAEYRLAVDHCADLTLLELARYTVHRHLRIGPMLGALQQAERATPQYNLQKLTRVVRGKSQFKTGDPLLRPVSRQVRDEVLAALDRYCATLSCEHRAFLERYRPADVAFKVVGTGSVGTRDYVILCFGSVPGDALFLQMKEEPPSAYAEYTRRDCVPAHGGQRVVEGQRLMQAQSDIFLGWTTMRDRHYLVRQLADHKAAVNPADLRGRSLAAYARMCGEVVGKGHARSGDAAVLAGYCGKGTKLDRAIAGFAFDYAKQVDADYALFRKAVKRGRLKVSRL